MKVANFLLPVVVIVAVVSAYFAGQYVGRHDTERLYAKAGELQAASESADRLLIAGAVADLMKTAQTVEALRVTEQYAGLQVETVKACLAKTPCSGWLATTSERRARLIALAERYGSKPSPN